MSQAGDIVVLIGVIALLCRIDLIAAAIFHVKKFWKV